MEKLTCFNELVEEILSFSLPCWRLSSTSPVAGGALELHCHFTLHHFSGAARKLLGWEGLWQWESRHPELRDHFLAQGQWSNFCPRQRLISSGLPFQELSFKATTPPGCARIMLSPEISAQPVSRAVHHSSQFVHKSEASFWESII